MGKGQIISTGQNGLYTINLVYPTTSFDAEISALNDKIADLTAKYNAFPTNLTPAQEQNKKVVLLSKIAMEKRKQYLESSFVETKTVSAWCADLTDDLTGDVGTIEVPGESENINIRPGYTDAAAYNSGRDGQLQPLVTMDYAGVFYNLAMLPGWQKWKPTYRYGTISNLVGDVADVSLESATSTQQGLNVNQEDNLTGVTIEYMDCNGSAFKDGDEVLIQFTGQDFSSPKIIGFKNNPQPCDSTALIVESGDYCFVWNVSNSSYLHIKDNYGIIVTGNVLTDDISDWLSERTKVSSEFITTAGNPESMSIVLDSDFTNWCEGPDCGTPGSDKVCYQQDIKDTTEEIEGWDNEAEENHTFTAVGRYFWTEPGCSDEYWVGEHHITRNHPVGAQGEYRHQFGSPWSDGIVIRSQATAGPPEFGAHCSLENIWDQDELYEPPNWTFDTTNERTWEFFSPFGDKSSYEFNRTYTLHREIGGENPGYTGDTFTTFWYRVISVEGIVGDETAPYQIVAMIDVAKIIDKTWNTDGSSDYLDERFSPDKRQFHSHIIRATETESFDPLSIDPTSVPNDSALSQAVEALFDETEDADISLSIYVEPEEEE
jgi:hypothetical protein